MTSEIAQPKGLFAIFNLPVGYHAISWVQLTDDGFTTDTPVHPAMASFLRACTEWIVAQGVQRSCHVACCYVRIVDAGSPENYMSWHTDNHDGGLRFATSISTDDIPVNLAWPPDDTNVGIPVQDTDWRAARQAPNGAIVVFTTEPHGVIPQEPRPGALTANFFATFYESREVADLYQTNNTATSSHQALPALETRR